MYKKSFLLDCCMGNEITITPTDQYIIDRIRALRLEENISQKKLSELISPSGDTSMVGKIESPTTTHKYTDHHLNIIAIKFNCSIHDFYPKERLSDVPQKKTKTPILKGLGPTGMLNAMIEAEEGYLNELMSTKEITVLSNTLNFENRPETDFTAIIARAVEKGILKRVEVKDENGKVIVKYQKA